MITNEPSAEARTITEHQWKALCAYHLTLTLMANSTPEQIGDYQGAAQLVLDTFKEAWP